MEQHTSKAEQHEPKAEQQNATVYKIPAKTSIVNQYWKQFHPVSYGVYGNKETDYKLCQGENPDSMSDSLPLGLPDHHVGGDF